MTAVARSNDPQATTRLSVWPPLPRWVFARRRQPELPFPLDDPRCRLFALGRHALWHGVRSAGLGADDEVLVPAYHHGSEVEALVQASLRCRFYEGTADLEPDPDELDRLATDRTRALLLIHYLGFPQDAPRWRAWCDERGLLLIEDAAQAWLAARDRVPVGSSGDVSIFCLYKTFGLPKGAALVGPPGTDPPEGRTRQLSPGPLIRRQVSSLRSRSSLLGRLGRPGAPAPSAATEEEFEFGDPHVAPSLGTRSLLPRVAEHGAAARRRENYAFLLGRLGDRVAAPFAELPSGASPFVFPLETRAKGSVLARLAMDGIHAFDLWSLAHPLLQEGIPAGQGGLRDRIVGLPVHQELRPADLARIADCAGAALEASEPRARSSV